MLFNREILRFEQILTGISLLMPKIMCKELRRNKLLHRYQTILVNVIYIKNKRGDKQTIFNFYPSRTHISLKSTPSFLVRWKQFFFNRVFLVHHFIFLTDRFSDYIFPYAVFCKSSMTTTVTNTGPDCIQSQIKPY